MKQSLLCQAVVSCVVLLGVTMVALGAPMPPRRAYPPLAPSELPPRPPSNEVTYYEQLYKAYLEPLHLYHENPPEHAPVATARERTRLSSGGQMYQNLVETHPAYISPREGRSLKGVISRVETMVQNLIDPTPAEQRGLLNLLEELGRQAREQLQVPLHPENAAAQPRNPVLYLHGKYARLLEMLENPSNIDKLTNQLDPESMTRYLDTHEVLVAARDLLSIVGEHYAARFPHFR